MLKKPIAFDEIIPFSDRLIAKCTDAFCIPTLGQIVDGYCLIFPYQRVLNLSLLDTNAISALCDFSESVCNAIRHEYGTPVLFEHGTAENGHPASCGVNWAHLHMVPNIER